nr:MAG TPA: hypothetical protein [Caudoviricetes sp.]DAY86252.1 MAG TPA: hypothetical protein [Caudoviricetes sp.]
MPRYPFNRLFILYYFHSFFILSFPLFSPAATQAAGFFFFNHTLSFSPILTRT